MSRRLALWQVRQKVRGWRRRERALKVWSASFAGFFPAVQYNGFGDRNWHTKVPVAQWHVTGPRASRRYQRACMAAMLEVVEHLRRAKPPARSPIRVVALIPVNDLFAASVDVFWGDASFFPFFDRRGPHQDWAPIAEPGRSLVREWELATDLAEVGYATTERWDEDDEAHSGELWAIGDVEILGGG